MLEIKGKINTAIAYAKVIEDMAVEQIRRVSLPTIDNLVILAALFRVRMDDIIVLSEDRAVKSVC